MQTIVWRIYENLLFEIEDLGLGYTSYFMDNKTYSFIRYSFQREAVYTYSMFQLPFRKCVLSTALVSVLKSTYGVLTGLPLCILSFLSQNEQNILWKKMIFLAYYSFYYIFSLVDVKSMLIFPCRNRKKIKVTIIQ